MSSTSFALRVALSAGVGGAWIGITTLVAERAGTRLGGVVGGVPSTVAISLLFVGLTQGPATAAAATTGVPLFVGLYVPLVVTYIWLGSRTPAGVAIGVALSVWLAPTVVVIVLDHATFVVSLGVEFVLLGIGVFAVRKHASIAAVPPPSGATLPVVALRSGLSGLVIGTAVVLARVGGPILGGAASAFPAVLLSTTLITQRSQGTEFSNEVARVLMLSAAMNIAVFVTVVRFSYPAWGIAAGTIAAFVASLFSAVAAYRFVVDR
jgi:hypothetical protein